jgi:predicted dehydrogenase
MAEGGASPLRTAVIGVGYLGRFHAQKYAQLPESQLVAVVDADREAATRVAAEVATSSESDYRLLLGRVDAVSVAVPTPLHFNIARDFLLAGALSNFRPPKPADRRRCPRGTCVPRRPG